MSHAEIKNAVIAMDENKIGGEMVKSLRQQVRGRIASRLGFVFYLMNLLQAPTAEDITTLKEFDGDRDKLGKVEKFFLETMTIPRYSPRLECWIFKLHFEHEVRG